MGNKRPIEFLISFARARLDMTKAEATFRKFMAGDFDYDELSSKPDYLFYASSDVLAAILPLTIVELLARNDLGNYLIHPLLIAIDPFAQGNPGLAERTEELVKLVDRGTAEKILRLLETIRTDPPVLIERIDRLIAFWRPKPRQR